MSRLVRGVILASAVLALPAAAAAAPPTSDPPTSDPPGEEGGDDLSGDTGTVTGGETGETVPVTLPLVPVPTGCTPPPEPHIVFVGEVVDRDVRTVRFRIDSIRYGRPDPFAGGDRIDVRYGLDAQYLDDGAEYLVAAVVDPDLGVLVSRVTDPIEHFGGDEVIGVSESDVSCPEFDDPMRTLHLDGTAIEGGVLDPFFDARIRILGSLLVPAGLALGAIFLLASLRLSVAGVYRGIVSPRRR
ncbi:MAG TPA: hypothetical protein VK917_05735 [Ilumatobacter sp.]|nr:hypothetical protein [Ilumatobacter sp.]